MGNKTEKGIVMPNFMYISVIIFISATSYAINLGVEIQQLPEII